jgi:hypothetical protein
MGEILDSELRPASREWAFSKPRNLLNSFALAAGTYVLFFLFFDPGFDTNDDPGMMALVSGTFRSEASPFMVFTHVSIGYVLKALYSWMPSVPWYAIYLYFFQILAWTLIAHVLFTLHRSREAVVFFVASFLLIGFQIAMELQFTSTSMLLGAAAALCFLALSLESKSWMLPVFSGGLIGIVGLIRGASLKATLAIWAPLFVYTAFKTPIRRTVFFGATIVSVSLAAATLSSVAYDSDARWREYSEYNAVRGKLHGNANFSPPKRVLKEVGWSKSDLTLFKRWFFTDPEVYSIEHLQTLLGSIQPESRWRSLSRRLTTQPFGHARKQLIGALLITLTLLAWTTPKRMSLVLANWAWIFLVGTAAVLLHGRMPLRVLVPMVLSATLASAFIAGIPRVALRPANLRQGVCLAFTILILLVSAVRVQTALTKWMHESRAHQAEEADLKKSYARLQAFDPDGIFVHWPRGIRPERLSPFTTGSDLPNLRFVWLGWQIGSPSWLDELDALEIDDVYTAILQKEHTYLLKARVDPSLIQDVTSFFKAHRGVSIKLHGTCLDSRCRIIIWSPNRLSSREEAQPD